MNIFCALAIAFWTASVVLAVIGLLVTVWIAALLEVLGLLLGVSLWRAVRFYVEVSV